MIPINVEPVNIATNENLMNSMREMFEGIDKYNDMAVNADLYLKSLPETATDDKEVSIRMNMPGKDIFIAKQGADFSAAASEVYDALKVALRRHKEIHKDKNQAARRTF